MSETKWTPGPWVFDPEQIDDGCSKSTPIYASNGRLSEPVAVIPHDDMDAAGERQIKANMPLIAAAPSLYLALQEFVNSPLTSKPLDDQDHSPSAQMYRMAVRALAKARGETP